MLLSKLKIAVAGMLAAGVLLVGEVVLLHQAVVAQLAAAPAAAAAKLPRRLLAIRVNNYLYANPVTSGYRDDKGHFRHTVQDMMSNIAERLHIDPSQFVDLSDSLPGEMVRPPLRPVIEGTLQAFLNGSRAQDRIIVYFAGHAVEIDGVPYLVPLEGELDSPATLIPLQWVYDRLAKCKARQKVLILDVCRHDPDRGRERPSSAAMGPKLDAAIRKPPSGVQVWSACQVGEYSHEFEVRGLLPGGAFLHQLHAVLTAGDLVRDQKPDDALPLAALVREVGARTRQVIEENEGVRQTPLLTGQEAPGGAAFDAREPLPARLAFPKFPPEGGDYAALREVAGILNETDVIPPAKMVPASWPASSLGHCHRLRLG